MVIFVASEVLKSSLSSVQVADVGKSGLQDRVLISAAQISPAFLIPPPAQAADEDCADDDSGHDCNDNEDDGSVMRNGAIPTSSTAAACGHLVS